MDREAKYNKQFGIGSRLDYYKNLKKRIEARSTMIMANDYRKENLRKQNLNNYQQEYDRIRGILSQSRIPGTSDDIYKRTEKLEKLGVRAVNKIDGKGYTLKELSEKQSRKSHGL